MSVGRRMPSFTIYRDDPVDQPTSSSTTSTTTGMTLRSRPAPTLQPIDKENQAPYTAPTTKPKKASSSSNTATKPNSITRVALATKYVAPPKESQPKSHKKSASSSSSTRPPTSSNSNNNANAGPVTPTRPKLTKSHSVGGISRKKKAPKERLASLPPLEEEVGEDGLTMADRRAIELTVRPLADVTEAFVASGCRKRSRALSIIGESEADSHPSSQSLTIVPTQTQTQPTEPLSTTPPGSPAKRVRLSPRADLVPLPPSPFSSPRMGGNFLRAESTLVDLEVEEVNHEPTLVGFVVSSQ